MGILFPFPLPSENIPATMQHFHASKREGQAVFFFQAMGETLNSTETDVPKAIDATPIILLH
jgi:hypothetical protein